MNEFPICVGDATLQGTILGWEVQDIERVATCVFSLNTAASLPDYVDRYAQSELAP
jgi:hypothetical protein